MENFVSLPSKPNKDEEKQRITLGISVLILLVLGFWVHSRWHVWFGNPEEPAYLPLNAPGRVLLTFGDKEELSRNISWNTIL